MVKVTHDQAANHNDLELTERGLQALVAEYGYRDSDLINECLQVAKQKVAEDELLHPAIQTGINSADILIRLNVDSASIACAILFPFYQAKALTQDQLVESFNSEIAHLCRGVETMGAISATQNAQGSKDAQQMDNLRRMLLAMVDDVRLVLVKLAERLSALRYVKQRTPEEQKQVAQEVTDIYAPLANRLGVGQIKWEMEDLAFRYLQPDRYRRLAKKLEEKRLDREQYIESVLKRIKSELAANQIRNADLMGRAKHIYSIWRKMQRKQVDFSEIYDVRAVRILVDQIPDCYATLGVIHGLWQHIPKEFDDYIATPKENGYRSLHTAVIGPEGKTLEVQIRTFEMHQESELGIAAHWRYKEGTTTQQSGFEAKIAWLRQLIDWQEEVADAGEFLDKFRNEVIEDRVYVFTPFGKVIDLPMGATPVDFAYHVHTQVGHTCRGAKVSGRIVPLTYKLKTGEQVEILTAKNGTPSRDWLNPHTGYIRSSRARSKIHQWFRHQDKDKNVAAGRTILDKDLNRHGYIDVDLNALSQRFNLHTADDLYAAVGAGDLGITQILNQVRAQLGESAPQKKVTTKPPAKQKQSSNSNIVIDGVGNLLTKIAGCCKPVPGDPIIGFITRGRGVAIHRRDCSHILKAEQQQHERLISVSWGDGDHDIYRVDLQVLAYDRQGLLHDITSVFSNAKTSVDSLNTSTNHQDQVSTINARVNVVNTEKLTKILAQLERIPNVFSVKRVHH